MKYLLFFLTIYAAISAPASAQTFVQYGAVDVSAYPTVSVQFWALNASQNPIRNLTPSQFIIRENNQSRTVTAVTGCSGSGSSRQDMSVVFTIDVSSSMNIGNRMAIAKDAARAGITFTDATRDEVAITSFDNFSYLNQDFTRNRTLLNAAIDSLQPFGGTNYDAGFLNAPGGALRIAQNGRNKRVVIFLTDGIGQGNQSQIINTATSNNITVYCIALEMGIPSILQNVATQTGGLAFGNVSTLEQLQRIYRLILLKEANITPCTVSWTAVPVCAERVPLNIEIASQSITYDTAYTMPADAKPALTVSPVVRAYGGVAPPATADQTVTLTCNGAPLNVTGASISNTRFTITNWGGSSPPFTLNTGQTRIVTIRFTPTDSSEQYADVTFQNNGCNTTFAGLYGGFAPRTLSTRTLQVVEPNGGEIVSTCDSLTVRWTGIPQSDTVNIEVSQNNGLTWQTLKDTVFGTFQYKIKTPPSLSGSQLRVRVSHIKFYRPDSVTVFRNGHYAPLNWTQPHPSPASNEVLSLCLNGNNGQSGMVIWNAATNDTLRRFQVAVGNYAYWRPDGNEICNVLPYALDCLNPTTGATIRTVAIHPFLLLGQSSGGGYFTMGYHPTNNNLAIVSAVDRLSKYWAVIMNLATGDTVRTFRAHDAQVTYCGYSADASRVVSCDLAQCYLWNPSTGAIIATYNHGGYHAAFNPAGTQLAIAANGTVYVYNASTGALVWQANSTTSTSVSWSPDGTSIVCADGSGVQRLNASNGSVIATIATPVASFYNFVTHRPNGNSVLLTGGPGGNRVYQLNPTTLATSSIFEYKRNNSGTITHVAVSSSGNRIVTASSALQGGDLRAVVWNTQTVDTARSFFGIVPMNGEARIALNHDGSQLATTGNLSTSELTLYNVSTGAVAAATTGLGYSVPAWAMDWSFSQLISFAHRTNNVYLTGRFAEGSEDSSQTRLYSNSGAFIRRFATVGYRMHGHVQNKDGTKLYTFGMAAGVPTIRSYNASTGALIATHYSSSGIQQIRSMAISNDEATITVHDANNTATVINASTGTVIASRNATKYPQISAAGRFVGAQNDTLVSRNLPGMGQYRLFRGHTGNINYMVMDSTKTIAVTSAPEGTARMWKLEREPVQIDSSDAAFSIATPQATTRNVNFNQVQVGESRDSLVATMLCNTGTAPLRIDSVFLAGANANNFEIIAGIGRGILAPGACRPIEIRFTPASSGVKTAELRVINQCDTSRGTLTGDGINAVATVSPLIIDFGRVEITTRRDTALTATLRNTGTAPMTISSTVIGRPDREQFNIQTGGGGFTLAAGESRAMSLRFAPVRVGRTSSAIRFTHNVAGSPSTLLVMGEGFAVARGTSSVASLNLPFDVCASTFTRDTVIMLRSNGTKPMIVRNTRIFGPDSALFRVVGYQTPDTLDAVDSVAVTVRFAPTAVGSRSATLRFQTDAENVASGNIDIQLSGVRDEANFYLSQSIVEMFNLPANTQKDTTVFINNTGTVPMRFDVPRTLGRWVLQSVAPNPVPVNSSATITFRFLGGALASVHDTTCQLRDTCGKTIDVRLTAVVQSPKPIISTIASLPVAANLCTGTVDTTIYITNGGLADLSITDVTIAGTGAAQYTVLRKPSAPITNGGRDSITLRFTPTAPGTAVASLIISSNADNADNGKTTIIITGISQRVAYTLSSTTVDFISVPPATPATQTLKLANTGSIPLRWNVPVTKGTLSITSVVPNPTPPNDTSVVTVVFAGAPSGTVVSDSIQLADTCGLNRTLRISAQVQSNKPVIISPATVQMAPVVCAAARDTLIAIRNGGLDTLRVSNATLIGTNAGEFSVVGFSPFTIAPLGTSSILVRFTPTGSGASIASLVVSSNADNKTSDTIALSATANRLQYSFSATTVTFTGIPQNISTTQTVTITNTGAIPVNFTVPVTSGEFTLESITPLPIPPGGKANAVLRIAAVTAGNYSRTINLLDSCAKPTALQLNATVLAGTAPVIQSLSALNLRPIFCGNTRDTLITVTNNGNAPLDITDIRFSGVAQNEYSVLSAKQMTIAATQSADIQVRYIPAALVGLRQAAMELVSNAANAPGGVTTIVLSVLNERISFRFSTSLVNFDTIAPNTPDVKPFDITNDGSRAIFFDVPIRRGRFVIDQVQPNPVPPGVTAQARVQFAGAAQPGEYSEQFIDTDSCNRTYTLGVTAFIRSNGPRSILQTRDAEAYPGEIADIPLDLLNRASVLQSGVRSIQTTIEFNATMLEPVEPTPQGTVVNNIRRIDVVFAPQPGTDRLGILKFRAMLGNDSVTDIRIINVQTQGAQVQVDTLSGEFKLLGVCYAGGARLVTSRSQAQSMTISPNPVHTDTDLELVVFEKGETSLEIVDITGRTLRTEFKKELPYGRSTVKLNLADMATGTYVLVLRTATDVITKRLEVMR